MARSQPLYMRHKTYNPKYSLLNQVLYRGLYIYIGHGRRDGKNRLGARELGCGNWPFGTHTLLSMGVFFPSPFYFFVSGSKHIRPIRFLLASHHSTHMWLGYTGQESPGSSGRRRSSWASSGAVVFVESTFYQSISGVLTIARDSHTHFSISSFRIAAASWEILLLFIC